MKSGQQKTKWALIPGIALAVGGLAIIIVLLLSPQKISQVKNGLLSGLPLISEPRETVRAELYFCSRTSPGLGVEARQVAKFSQLSDQGREIIAQLLKGPQTEGLAAAIPEGTSLQGLYIDQAGCAYVDFSSHISRQHPGGSCAELQTIYSVVNTLISNLEPVKRVRILVDGAEIDTLAGHVDTRHPITFQQL